MDLNPLYTYTYTHTECMYIYSVYLYAYIYIDTHVYTHTPPFSLLVSLFTSQTSGYGEFYLLDYISIHRPIPTSSHFPFYMIDTFKSSRKKA